MLTVCLLTLLVVKKLKSYKSEGRMKKPCGLVLYVLHNPTRSLSCTPSPPSPSSSPSAPSLVSLRAYKMKSSVCIAMKTPQTYLAGTQCSWANLASRRLGREGTSHMLSHTASRIAPGDKLCTRSHLTSRRVDREGSRNTNGFAPRGGPLGLR